MQILERNGCRKIVAYLWRPSFAPALDFLRHDVSCYHINDEYSFSSVEKPLEASEEALIAQVDQVFIHSPKLLEKKGGINPHTQLVPNGVNYQRFSIPASEPNDMRDIPHPRIGYVGLIKNQLDLKLLVTLARRHREWSFVFVGPRHRLGDQEALFDDLTRMPNVFALGRKPVDSLPAYVQHMDVCTMCYLMNGYTKFIYPLKLHEYLASGKPVVGSPIASLMQHKEVIQIASTPGEWSRALSASLATEATSSGRSAARRAVAAAHDWDNLVEGIARTICQRLGPTYLDRFERLVSSHGHLQPSHP